MLITNLLYHNFLILKVLNFSHLSGGYSISSSGFVSFEVVQVSEMFLESLHIWKSLLAPSIGKNFAKKALFLRDVVAVAPFSAGITF